VGLAAVGATVSAAWVIRDPLTSIAVAAVASLVILPITWYHYPAALVPFAIAAVARSHSGSTGLRARLAVLCAGLAATLAIAWLPLLYLAVALGLYGVVLSRRSPGPN
jgi:hypothetical protein